MKLETGWNQKFVVGAIMPYYPTDETNHTLDDNTTDPGTIQGSVLEPRNYFVNRNQFNQLRVKLLSEYRRRETSMAKTEMVDTEMILQPDG